MLALAIICKGDKKEAEHLSNCLKYAAPHVDKIFVTIAGGKNKKAVEDVCGMFNAEVSYFKWCNDFSKARNHNFAQVPKEYTHILWLDADDGIRGADKLKQTIKDNPDVDAFMMDYLYAFDENKNPIVVHPKTRVLKNNGAVVWDGALHEDFKSLREISTKMIDGIEVIHLSNDERFEEAKVRNLEVAEKQLADNPQDPRSFWNVGNSLKALGRDEDALEIFEEFMKTSRSDDEKYIVLLRMAESYWNIQERDKAIDMCKFAIGTKPEFPDAYNLAGSLHLDNGSPDKAIEFYLQGLTKKPPYHQIMVYNPRDYDYIPMMNLARAYWEKGLPTFALPLLEGCSKIMPKDEGLTSKIRLLKKECKKFDKVSKVVSKLKDEEDLDKIKAELDKVDVELQSHPMICHLRNVKFVKEKSSGRDLVFFCGFTEREWNPEVAKNEGIGGSEEAVIHLAQGLAAKYDGENFWNVTVYNNCGHKTKYFTGSQEIFLNKGNKPLEKGEFYINTEGKACLYLREKDGRTDTSHITYVTYKTFWSLNYRNKEDVTILWRSARPLDYDINSKKVYLDLHDVMQDGEFTEQRMAKCDGVFVKSEFHTKFFPSIDPYKFIIAPNGIVSETFKGKVTKDPMLMINTSSPDRSLSALVECFKEVKKREPGAKCKWAYGWGVWDAVHENDSEMKKWKENMQKEMKKAGIEELGMISHSDVADLYKKASILAYPSEFAEIDCISLSKALASGCVPITTTFAAMGEKMGYGGHYIHSEKTTEDWAKPYQFDYSIEDEQQKKDWVDATVRTLKKGYSKKRVEEMRKEALKDFDWKKIITAWDKELKS